MEQLFWLDFSPTNIVSLKNNEPCEAHLFPFGVFGICTLAYLDFFFKETLLEINVIQLNIHSQLIRW